METNTSTLPTVGSLFNKSIALFKQCYKRFILIGIIPAVLLIISDTLGSIWDEGGSEVSGLLIVAAIIFFIANLAVQLVIQILYIKAVKECEEGGTSSIKDLYTSSFKLFWPSLLITVLVMLVTMGASVFLIIPGMIAAVYLAFARYFLVVENKRGMDTLVASYYYVKGNWWQVFGRLALLGLIVLGFVAVTLVIIAIIFIILPGVESAFSDNLISNIVMTIFSYLIIVPFTNTYLYFLYRDLKGIKPEPTAETDLSTPRKWFIGLAILTPVAMLLGVAIFAIVTMALR